MERHENILIPTNEQSVDFYGDEITTALVTVENGTQVYVPLRPICEYLGLSWSGQYERVTRDLVLSQEVKFVRVTRTKQRGNPNVVCLPLEFLNGWLFGVNAARVKPELKEKVLRYQRECHKILSHAFQIETYSTENSRSSPFDTLEQLRHLGLAIASMAEQQIEMEQRINTRLDHAAKIDQYLSTRLDRAAQVVSNIERRLNIVEHKFSPQMLITDEQAEEISTSVKALAELITAHDPNKNHYQSIFAELYRRFGVSSYKNIHFDQYERVLLFLEDWRKSVASH